MIPYPKTSSGKEDSRLRSLKANLACVADQLFVSKLESGSQARAQDSQCELVIMDEKVMSPKTL